MYLLIACCHTSFEDQAAKKIWLSNLTRLSYDIVYLIKANDSSVSQKKCKQTELTVSTCFGGIL